MRAISVHDVCKVFVDRRGSAISALDNVQLTIGSQEIVCVVGPSGCGKSTLLNLIAGFDVPSSGVVTMDGVPVGAAGPDRSVVFQSPSLFPWLTILENVTFGPRKRGVPKAQCHAAAREMIEAVGLERFANHYPYELSGGMRQRAQIARALVNNPQVLLMDEPFAALDFQNRLMMQELVLRLWHRVHPTIFFITHDVEEAIFLGDRVYVMTAAPGRIKATIEVPFDKPRSMEVTGEPEFVAIKNRVLRLIREEFDKSERVAAGY
jgi:NitT/TauT family transport system ATP-binding protein